MVSYEELQSLEKQGDYRKILSLTTSCETVIEKYYQIRSLERTNQPDLALDLINQYEQEFREIRENMPEIYAWYLHNYGTIKFLHGDLDRALELYQEVMEIRDRNGLKMDQVLTYSNMGEILRYRGSYEESCAYFLLAIDAARIYNHDAVIAFSLYSLIQIKLIQGKLGEAGEYFTDLQKLWETTAEIENQFIHFSFKFSKALMLKYSRRMKDKMEALSILEEMLDTLNFYSHLTYEVIISIVDLLFLEYKSLEDEFVFEDIMRHIKFLETSSLDNQMYMIYINSQILLANLNLIQGDLTTADTILKSIQKLADEKNLTIYLTKIQAFQDSLIDHIESHTEALEENVHLYKQMRNSELQNYINFLLSKKK